jgi:NADPH:quinone reductase-like Zn-dependent oxidoreductase
MGVRVIAATKEAEEREYLLSLGAEKVIVTEEEDLLMRINKITDNRGVDVVFDGLGGPQMSLLGDVLAPRGSLVLYGSAGWQSNAVPGLRSVPEEHPVLRALHRQLHRQAGTGHYSGSRRACSVPCVTSTS